MTRTDSTGDTEVAGTMPAVTVIGGELLEFSDLEPPARPPMGGPAALALLDALVAPGARVLLAGPYEPAVVETVAGRAGALDLLVRSYPDAETHARRPTGNPGVTGPRVYAGGLDRFGIEHGAASYDLVVALDGTHRLFGPDSDDLGWPDAVAALCGRVAPGGRLLLGVANRIGLDRLIDARGAAMPSADGDWPRTTAGAPDPPAGRRHVRAALTAAGLTLETEFATFPDLSRPVLAAGVPELADGGVPGSLVATAMAAPPGTSAGESGPLIDPYRLTREAVAAGLGADLAPGWWFVAVVGTAAAADLPPVIGQAAAVPAGQAVEELVLEACRKSDQLAVRRLVESYIGWLRTTDTPAPADAAVLDGERFTALRPDGSEPAGDLEVIGYLRRLVVRLMAAGVPLPWPTAGSPRGLTTLLAATAGITVDDDQWRQAGSDVELRPAGYTEALGAISRLSRELDDAHGQIRGLEAELGKVRGSVSLRVGQVVTAPLKVVYRGVDRLVKRFRGLG